MIAIGRITKGMIDPGALHRATRGLFGGVEVEAEDILFEVVYIDREHYGTVYIDQAQDKIVYIDRESYEEVEL